MRRRELLGALAGAVAWPLGVRAQQSGKLPIIGFLGTGSSVAWSRWTPAFVQRLQELGWIEGRTVTIEYRWADGREERYPELVAELVRLNVSVIVTGGGALVAAKQATSTIPIVFALAGDPVGSGAVVSLARPGGNVTGLSSQAAEIAGKRLDLLREVVPGLRQLAIMANAEYSSAGLEIQQAQAAARVLGLKVATYEIRRADEIASAFEALKGHAEALFVPADPLVNSNRVRISDLALGARLPTMFGLREYVEAGGLMSYGPNIPDLFRHAGDYADKILRGAKPSDLPVQNPTKFELAINLKVARALGLTVPPSFLARADEVIE